MAALDYHDLDSLDGVGIAIVADALGDHRLAERARAFLDPDTATAISNRRNQMTYPHGDQSNNRNNNQQQGRQQGNQTPSDERDDGPIIPIGEYPVRAVAHRIGFAGTGTEQIGVRLMITEGEYKGSRALLWYGFFTDAALETTIKALRALGFRGDDLRNMSTLYDGAATAVVEHEAGQKDGILRARVRWINGADVVMKETMDTNTLAAFATRMRGALARNPGSGAAPKDPQQGQSQGNRPPANTTPPRQDGSRQASFGGNQGNQRGGHGGGYNDAPPPSDDDRPPFERGGRRG